MRLQNQFLQNSYETILLQFCEHFTARLGATLRRIVLMNEKRLAEH
jgi:hypothetical protein